MKDRVDPPPAGRHPLVAGAEQPSEHPIADAIVADTGGTSYDVSVVRRGRLTHSVLLVG